MTRPLVLSLEEKYAILTKVIRETGSHPATRTDEGIIPGEPKVPQGAMTNESWDEYQTWLEEDVIKRLERGWLYFGKPLDAHREEHNAEREVLLKTGQWSPDEFGPPIEEDEELWAYAYETKDGLQWWAFTRSVWEIGA